MDINRFTEKAQEALAAAQRLALRFQQQQVDVEHVVLALLDQEHGLAPAILAKAGVAVEALKLRVQRELEKLPRVTSTTGAADQVYVTGRLNRLQFLTIRRYLSLVFLALVTLLLVLVLWT